ncbi:ABC-type polysaccharide/polyol phosphate transport system ATPase subunit [Algoriphagus ratkowskyi]|uniref:ABC transporter ATP-binding protein n=1 Tax=Algoriphagus ratkowskyi TaxID=57028 RepID=A0A2W7RHE3_9BACT|nr:ABC transporter ATP-binding protein [Algoriphagus ratkowskyi]PZX57790.1 ABC-type polysaccharide/polyol phosphate transport system ATPase subunit [Algoriphagus ratkowskyi]TXD79054.1 ABC transporter ATP-binding protein [Algoriphagus ratkowskyi]
MRPVIKVENVSKLYRLGEIGTGTISHDINRWWAKMRGKEDPFSQIGSENDRSVNDGSDYAWALKDINFEVAQGDVLGIIGRNGAGKSTLLKILSRVTLPTKGGINVKGRVASLLEVGTGFHPELTGKENIFLNGAILGMTKAEIKRKFDEIVDFAGIAKYVDTPVKRYSSGMYVRLAFAVAAHLDSEILIMDEVLAVGDAEFQKKCLGKMGDVSRNEGRTILFVSHNMASVKSLCTQGIVLHNGQYAFEGTTHDAVNFYQQNSNLNQFVNFSLDSEDILGNANIKILEFKVEALTGDYISVSSGVAFECTFYNEKVGINLDVTFELVNSEEVKIFHHAALISKDRDSKRGLYKVKGHLSPYILNAGQYKFNIIFGENQRYVLFKESEVVGFDIANESMGSNTETLPGVLRPNISYEIDFQK